MITEETEPLKNGSTRRSSIARPLRLTLGFEARDGKTVFTANRSEGPLKALRVHDPDESGFAHVYILNPSGGILGGDEVVIEVHVGQKARVLLTTPSATKFYKPRALGSTQRFHANVQHGGTLAWLPHEAILYNGACVTNLTTVHLMGSGAFLGWDVRCLGRPSAKEAFVNGMLRTSFEVWKDHTPILLERGTYMGSGTALSAPWGLWGYPAFGLLVWTTKEAHPDLEPLRNVLAGIKEPSGITSLHGLILSRVLGRDGRSVRETLHPLLKVFLDGMTEKPASLPRLLAS